MNAYRIIFCKIAVPAEFYRSISAENILFILKNIINKNNE